MSSRHTFETFCDKQGWNDASQRDVLERYIENQQDDDAFVGFLQETAMDEGVECSGQDLEDIAAEMGWSDVSIVSLQLRYIENQDSSAAFEDFLAEQADFENSYSVTL